LKIPPRSFLPQTAGSRGATGGDQRAPQSRPFNSGGETKGEGGETKS